MREIRVLSEQMINRIAAGEVVERPASVVKELCENSLDAGADRIKAEIADGGVELIRVTDNGSGIPVEQAAVAFERHATSKLAGQDELDSIMTMGFRGEALSSVAAISHTELVTKTADSETAVKIAVSGGAVLSVTETAAPDGTSVSVRDLFYNTPARRKFLKTPGTEGGYANDAAVKLAFGRPDVAFTFINNGSEVFRTTGGGLKTATLSVLGRDAASKLADVDYARGFVRVTGVTCKPELSRGNRAHGFFYINNRYIKNPVAQSAVEAAYKTRLMTGKFPVYILNMEIPPELVDINVHPAKLEARFSREVDVFKTMLAAVESALRPVFLVPGPAAPPFQPGAEVSEPIYDRSVPVYERSVTKAAPSFPPVNKGYGPIYAENSDSPSPPASLSIGDPEAGYDANIFKADIPDVQYIHLPKPETRKKSEDFRIVGQFFGTYWLLEQPGGPCYMMDQHAAHERVLFEELTESLSKTGTASQRVIDPIALKLTPREKQAVVENMKLLTDMGFEIEDMYDDNIAVRSVPYVFDKLADGAFFREILDRLCDVDSGDYEASKPETVSRIACRAAVKANDHLSEKEARALVERVLDAENPFTCPHGRPVLVEIPRKEIEKMFKRVV